MGTVNYSHRVTCPMFGSSKAYCNCKEKCECGETHNLSCLDAMRAGRDYYRSKYEQLSREGNGK